MKMLAMSATMVAALLGINPAAAQKADPSAICVILMTEMETVAEQRANELPDDAKSQIKYLNNAMHFHLGVLRARYSDDQLVPVMKASFAELRRIPRETRPELAKKCFEEEFDVLALIANGLKN